MSESIDLSKLYEGAIVALKVKEFPYESKEFVEVVRKPASGASRVRVKGLEENSIPIDVPVEELSYLTAEERARAPIDVPYNTQGLWESKDQDDLNSQD